MPAQYLVSDVSAWLGGGVVEPMRIGSAPPGTPPWFPPSARDLYDFGLRPPHDEGSALTLGAPAQQRSKPRTSPDPAEASPSALT